MKPNNYAMKDWHLEHVEKVIIRFVKNEITKNTARFQAVQSKSNTTSSTA
jgi:hypothetical protein